MVWPFTGVAKAKAPKREKARAFGFDASRFGRRLRGWTPERRNINSLLTTGGELLRARARQLCRENPYAANALEAFVAASVGTGIKPSPLYLEAARKAAVTKAFLRWTDEADADGLTDFYGLQALAARAAWEAGDCFIRMIDRPSGSGLSVPFQLQLLEAEMLPLSHNETLANGNIIRSGIEFDSQRRRVNYHFLSQHPGEASSSWKGMARTVVPASEVLHLYRPLRPGQVRGQPGITPGMVRLYLLDGYDDAELDRKKTAALFAGFVKRPLAGESALTGHEDDSGRDAAATEEPPPLELQPGTLQMLGEGEEVTFSQPADVGGSYEAFQFRNLCAISVAVGVPYHTVSGDLSKANYGSQRGGQVEFRRRMDQFQHMTLVFQMCRPVWQRWFQSAVLAGVVPISPGEWNTNRADLIAAKWIPPRWEWIDPLKDRQAERLAVRNGFKPLSEVQEAEGYDAEQVLEDIAVSNAAIDARGITLDSDPRLVSQAGLTQARAAGSVIPSPSAASPENEHGFAEAS